jgi:hypothetical protein
VRSRRKSSAHSCTGCWGAISRSRSSSSRMLNC